MAEGKSHPDYLPTRPGTQVAMVASKPWCAGHPWRGRNRILWWAHHAGHRLGLLRIRPPRPLAYLEGRRDA